MQQKYIQYEDGFRQPLLVSCVTCGKDVSFHAGSCGHCSEPDPAKLKNDPHGRTQARIDWDVTHSFEAAVAASEALEVKAKQRYDALLEKQMSHDVILWNGLSSNLKENNSFEDRRMLFSKMERRYREGQGAIILGMPIGLGLSAIFSNNTLSGIAVAAFAVAAGGALVMLNQIKNGYNQEMFGKRDPRYIPLYTSREQFESWEKAERRREAEIVKRHNEEVARKREERDSRIIQ